MSGAIFVDSRSSLLVRDHVFIVHLLFLSTSGCGTTLASVTDGIRKIVIEHSHSISTNSLLQSPLARVLHTSIARSKTCEL
jgi:hypothetical protein